MAELFLGGIVPRGDCPRGNCPKGDSTRPKLEFCDVKIKRYGILFDLAA
jgi:hypothetical protein